MGPLLLSECTKSPLPTNVLQLWAILILHEFRSSAEL